MRRFTSPCLESVSSRASEEVQASQMNLSVPFREQCCSRLASRVQFFESVIFLVCPRNRNGACYSTQLVPSALSHSRRSLHSSLIEGRCLLGREKNHPFPVSYVFSGAPAEVALITSHFPYGLAPYRSAGNPFIIFLGPLWRAR